MRTYWKEAEQAARDAAPKAQTRMCDHPACAAAAEFRAPKDRTRPNDYYWFCLPHVQEYNKSWNYYQGLSLEEMEDVRRQDVVGWRPTWPLGTLRPKGKEEQAQFDANRVTPDQLRARIFREFFGGKAGGASTRANKAAMETLSPEEQDAFTRFNLSLKASWYEIKRRYRELAKAHHPDTHQDDAEGAAEQLKLINVAYATLKKRFRQS